MTSTEETLLPSDYGLMYAENLCTTPNVCLTKGNGYSDLLRSSIITNNVFMHLVPCKNSTYTIMKCLGDDRAIWIAE
jgi:hypothetical protein